MLGKDDLTAKLEALVLEIAKLDDSSSGKEMEDLVEKLCGFMERLADVDRMDEDGEKSEATSCPASSNPSSGLSFLSEKKAGGGVGQKKVGTG